MSMVYLLLAILANILIFAVFRVIPRLRAVTLHTIVVNYWVCVITGAMFVGKSTAWEQVSLQAEWTPWMFGLSVIFILAFLMMAFTTQKMGVTVATIASKMSLVVPVLFSILVLGAKSKDYDLWNYLGMGLVIPAIFLSSWSKSSEGSPTKPRNLKGLALPLGIFLAGGVIDSTMNYVSLNLISDEFSPIFTILLFATTGTYGIIILMVRRELPSRRSVLAGVLLGVPNYFSIYLILASLSAFNNDGAILYPILNMGVILGSAILGFLAFRERPNKVKLGGLFLALLALLLLSYQELFGA